MTLMKGNCWSFYLDECSEIVGVEGVLSHGERSRDEKEAKGEEPAKDEQAPRVKRSRC